jgi:uncharacterized protein with HEPN domain
MDKNVVIVEKMLLYAKRVAQYIGGLDYDCFSKQQLIIDACVLNISQLGELTRQLDKEYRDAHPDLPWYSIYNLRNRIVHDYEGIKLDVVWQVITYHLPALREKLEALLQEARP